MAIDIRKEFSQLISGCSPWLMMKPKRFAESNPHLGGFLSQGDPQNSKPWVSILSHGLTLGGLGKTVT